ncbi:MAG: hypothetical protein KGL39_25990 [Patescibacteria group bacterium]|nr:hypothetical protein [Patescibacteria group bacterium]
MSRSNRIQIKHVRRRLPEDDLVDEILAVWSNPMMQKMFQVQVAASILPSVDIGDAPAANRYLEALRQADMLMTHAGL